MEQEYQDIEFRKYWEIIKKRWRAVLMVALIVLGIGLLLTISSPKKYQSSTLIKIKEGYFYSLFNRPPALRIVNKKQEIISHLNLTANDFDLVEIPSESLLKIESWGETPSQAKNLADLVAKATIDLNEKLNADLTSLERKRIEEIKKEIEEIENSLKKLKPGEISSVLLKNQRSLLKDQLADWQYKIDPKIQKLEIVSPAFMPTSPSKPNLKSNLIASFILGLFLGILWAFSMEYLKKTKVSGF